MNSTRAERLNEAFNYLRFKGLVKTQKDLAEAIGSTAPNVSSALKGNERFLTDSFIVRFSDAFGEVSSHWLLTGEGEMLKDESISQNAYGDNNQIAGRDINNGVSGNTTTTNNTTNNNKDSGAFETSLIEKAIYEMGEQRKLFAEQINRLLTIIEKMSNK